MCIILLFNPSFYAQSCLNGISVWALKVLPLLFPFFVLTRIIVGLSSTKQSFMDKFWNKCYNVPSYGFSTFFLSTIAGYPMGAKLISNLYENGQVDSIQAKKMLSFCSVSGPMFMLGTVGIAILRSPKAGILILISNILACIINGLLYRGNHEVTTNLKSYEPKEKTNLLSDSVHDSLISILMVGSYIVLSFLIIDILQNLHITQFLSSVICSMFRCKPNQDVVISIINGFFEITRGIIDLSACNLSLKLKTIMSSTLIGFGGISILMQSLNFLSKLKVSVKTVLKQKTTQAILCFVISTLLCCVFM